MISNHRQLYGTSYLFVSFALTGQLAEYAGVGRTALSHHLMVLKLADLVRVERRGQFQVYSLNTTVFQDLLTEILGWLGGIDDSSPQEDDTTTTQETLPEETFNE